MAKLNYFIHFTLVILLLSAATVTAKTAMGTTVGAAEIENKNGTKLGEKPAFTSSRSPLIFRFLRRDHFPRRCHMNKCDTERHPKERCKNFAGCGECNTESKKCTYVSQPPPYVGEEEEVVDGEEVKEVAEVGKGDDLYIGGIKVGDEDGEYEIDEEYYQGKGGDLYIGGIKVGDEDGEYEIDEEN